MDKKTGMYLGEPPTSEFLGNRVLKPNPEFVALLDNAFVFDSLESAIREAETFPFSYTQDLFARPVTVSVRLAND